MRQLCDLPVVASMTFDEDLGAADGSTPEAVAAALVDAGVDALGVNCGSGPSTSLEALGRMAAVAGDRPLLIMPNAGLPSRVEGTFVYAAGPAYFGEAVPTFLRGGARLDRRLLRDDTRPHRGDAPGARPRGGTRSRDRGRLRRGRCRSPPARRCRSRPRRPAPIPRRPTRRRRAGSRESLAAGRFVISVEIDPPRSVLLERTVEAARLIKASGADLVNISDSAMARVRMGAMAVAFALSRDPGIECLVHVTTRDRNLMALESELLGAHALGIRDILALTGDPPPQDEHLVERDAIEQQPHVLRIRSIATPTLPTSPRESG